MTNSPLEASLKNLTDIQRRAVNWNDGALLVLAGPSSGKTRVLTCRIARLLYESADRQFRVLALTFTNKAANEVASRVADLVPRLEMRATIGTFHSFCAEVLRQHGAHLGLRSDFSIYSQNTDRQAVLEDALRRARAYDARFDAPRYLPLIDSLKARLVRPEQAQEHLQDMTGWKAEAADRVAGSYRLYETELRRNNALDFNSLIFEAHRLFTTYPVLANHYQVTYPYWLVDEFQDTNHAQYALLRSMAVPGFREIFAVADDDQTIFEWHGADVRRIRQLVKDFSCEALQLPTNFRCPPRIVEAANRLVAYNARRVASKRPAKAARYDSREVENQIQYREFDTDQDEAVGVVEAIAQMGNASRGQTAVLARNRHLLELMHRRFTAKGIRSAIMTRRDDFKSSQIRWLVASLRQIRRPLDQRNMAVLVDTFNSFSHFSLDFDNLLSRSESERVHYLTEWTNAVREFKDRHSVVKVAEVIAKLASGNIRLTDATRRILEYFESDTADDELKDDISAWRRIENEIRHPGAFTSLDLFLQELDLRPKEPVRELGTVSLMTIHGAKGLEFDTVYLIGLAEEILPSWHSVKKGNDSAAIEEERRECFVAITRTKKRLILSRARRYRGWLKEPSRFLVEMGVLDSMAAGFSR